MSKPFTIVGYYEDTNQTYVEHVNADDWVQAMAAVVLNHPTNEASDLIIVSVFDGHLKDQSEHEMCVAACDVPGIAQCDGCDKFIKDESVYHSGNGFVYCLDCTPD